MVCKNGMRNYGISGSFSMYCNINNGLFGRPQKERFLA